MTPVDVERVFGRGRLKMVTGEHVEVYREPARPGERRRYTKRFLHTGEGDFRRWTEREWRILARLVGHGIGPVPDVVQFDRGSGGGPALVQTYDAGVTVDHWATLLPVERDGRVLHHVFEDCAHWWALAQHCLIALDAIHELQLVHLDLKADNVCIPLAPADFDPGVPGQVLRPQFAQIALIDFAFSLVSGEPLATALPIGHQLEDEYQSPRLLRALEAGRRGDLMPTRQLDWRCDMFSLAAMLRRYLPDPDGGGPGGWGHRRLLAAQTLVDRLFDAHHGHATAQRPHRELIELAASALREPSLAASLERGWRLASEAGGSTHATPTPATRIVLPATVMAEAPGLNEDVAAAQPEAAARVPQAALPAARPRRREGLRQLLWVLAVMAGGAASVPLLAQGWLALQHERGTPAAAYPPVMVEHAVARAAEEELPVTPGDTAVDEVAEPAPAPAPATTALPASAPAPATTAMPASAAPAVPPSTPPPTASAAPAPRTASRQPAAAPKGPRAAKAVVRSQPVTPSKASAATAKTAVPARPAPARVVVSTIPPGARSVATASSSGSGETLAKVTTLPPATTASAPTTPPRPATTAAIPTPPPTPAVAAPMPAPAAAPASAAAAPPRPVPAEPPSTPVTVPAADASPPAAPLPDDFTARANTWMSEHLPRIAQRAERLVLRVLHVAAMAETRLQDAEVLSAASAARQAADRSLAGVPPAADDARRLQEAAATAFWSARSPHQALALQMRAFGAQPNDAEIAGNLAYYHLKQRPVQAEAARRLALHALTLGHPQAVAGRIEDWTTFAIASALTGRERDARNAMFVMMALSPTMDRPCRAAVAAVMAHGERLRAPAEALLLRIRAAGRSHESTFCRWPPNWSASR